MVFKLLNWGEAKKGDVHTHAGETRGQADGAEAHAPTGGQQTGFGVRSYLGTFYASPSDEQKGWYLLPPPQPSKYSLMAFRLICLLSMVAFVAGAGLVTFGYLGPTDDVETQLRKLDAQVDSSGNVWLTREALAEFSSDPMHIYKILGVILFASGGIVLAGTLIIVSCFDCCNMNHYGDHSADVALSPAGAESQAQGKVFKGQQTGGSPVPVAGSVAKVQPTSKNQTDSKKNKAHQKKQSPTTTDQVMMSEGEKSAI